MAQVVLGLRRLLAEELGDRLAEPSARTFQWLRPLPAPWIDSTWVLKLGRRELRGPSPDPQEWRKPAPRGDADEPRASPLPIYVHAPT